MNLRGIIYHGGYHFSSQIIDKTGNIWTHDGTKFNGQCIIAGKVTPEELGFLGIRTACIAVYSSNKET
ncbi:hypothetical protein K439DRAFT_1357133 [Ramaria rubella]|nr:hypothetical protein K439DRAFT_1357133 [Ramaria rubella]